MVTFHKLGELGRLGNQLFQYAALKGLASKNGYTAKIPNPQTMNWHGQTCLLDRFNIECDYLTQDDVNTLQNLYEEPNWKKYGLLEMQTYQDVNIWVINMRIIGRSKYKIE
mgnify:CR=1 FL=1